MRNTRCCLYAAVLLFSLSGFVVPKLDAQDIQIKLIDGRNGKPLANTYVNVWVGNDRKEATVIPTDSKGAATLHLITESSKIDTSRKWGGYGMSGVADPVFIYQDDIRVNVGYVLCQTGSGSYSWLRINEYATKDLVQTGVASTNMCGKATAERKSGELILFVRPLSWWEKMRQ
jgi:hypothetical protein